jgi:hypothetical protein
VGRYETVNASGDAGTIPYPSRGRHTLIAKENPANIPYTGVLLRENDDAEQHAGGASRPDRVPDTEQQKMSLYVSLRFYKRLCEPIRIAASRRAFLEWVILNMNRSGITVISVLNL